MVSQEQAKVFVKKLSALIDENEESNTQLVKKSYVISFENAKKSIETRIENNEFPTLAALRKKFGIQPQGETK